MDRSPPVTPPPTGHTAWRVVWAMQLSFLLALLVGFVAESIDGALGMAYGLISSTVMLAFGYPRP